MLRNTYRCALGGARARLQSTVSLRGIPRDATVEEVRAFLGVIPSERITFRYAHAIDSECAGGLPGEHRMHSEHLPCCEARPED